MQTTPVHKGADCSLATPLFKHPLPTSQLGVPKAARPRVVLFPSPPRPRRASRPVETVRHGDCPAAQALDWGLLNRVVPADQVLGTALGLAAAIAAIAAIAPLAARAARRVLRASADLTSAEALALEAEVSAGLARTEDAAEGPTAFIEKRPPVFRGR